MTKRVAFAAAALVTVFLCTENEYSRPLWRGLGKGKTAISQNQKPVGGGAARGGIKSTSSDQSEAKTSIAPAGNATSGQRWTAVEASTPRDRRLLERATSLTEEELKALVAKKMVPRHLALDDDYAKLLPRQFLHLHHMKTAGTSMDSKLGCAMSRMRRVGTDVPYYSLHECSASHYKRCKAGEDQSCKMKMESSAIVSYCAPLKDLSVFGWDAYEPEDSRRLSESGDEPEDATQERRPIPQALEGTNKSGEEESDANQEVERVPIPDDNTVPEDGEDVQRVPIPETPEAVAEPNEQHDEIQPAPLKSSTVAPYDSITVLRHPVERVWSMFRFQTRNCYNCRNLTDIYHSIDVGKGNERIDQLCQRQILNHQTANLLSSQSSGDPARQDLSEEETGRMVNEAIHNMQNFFTIIGLTEELAKTVELVDTVFPWMAEKVDGSDKTCPLPHANSSPRNNRCGPDYTHWDLPDHPDEETTKAIIAHNKLDMKLYEAATQLFQLQWEVHVEEENSG